MEQVRVGTEDGKVFSEEGFFLDEDADDDDRFVTVFFQGVAAVRLTKVAVAFFHGNPILAGSAEGLVISLVGEVYKEEVLAMEALVDMAARKGAEHDFIGRIAEPLGNEFRSAR